jgi:hypothetical protein
MTGTGRDAKFCPASQCAGLGDALTCYWTLTNSKLAPVGASSSYYIQQKVHTIRVSTHAPGGHIHTHTHTSTYTHKHTRARAIPKMCRIKVQIQDIFILECTRSKHSTWGTVYIVFPPLGISSHFVFLFLIHLPSLPLPTILLQFPTLPYCLVFERSRAHFTAQRPVMMAQVFRVFPRYIRTNSRTVP